MAEERNNIKELDYAIGRLVAEVSALRESDERLTAEMKGFKIRIEDMEAGTNAAKGAMKLASWLLGSILVLIISLGAWMVKSTIVNEEQRDIIRRDFDHHINSEGHQGTINLLYELKTNVQTIQLENTAHNKNIDDRLDRMERRRYGRSN